MKLIKFFVMFVGLIGRICLAKIMIEINKPNGFAELEEAAIETLTTCYATKDKTIVLIGDYPGNFIKRLSSHQSFSLVLLDDRRRRREDAIDDGGEVEFFRLEKIHVVVMIASYYSCFGRLLAPYRLSGYNNPMAFVLAIGWSPITKCTVCDGQQQTWLTLYILNNNNQLNVNLLCRDRTKEIVMYSSNSFTNQAPKPWRWLGSVAYSERHLISYFVRDHRAHEGMCKNLHFDTTHDLGGSVIVLVHEPYGRMDTILNKVNEAKRLLNVSKTINLDTNQFIGKRSNIQSKQTPNLFFNFVNYVHATKKVEWRQTNVNGSIFKEKRLSTRLQAIRGEGFLCHINAYPHATDCNVLVTQFRGNKSQLRKLYDVIDKYSWIGMYMVFFITLIFFKYFMRQPLIEGILNLCRLTCNLGLTTLPPNVAPQIYLACLLFFVVTMQGIFVGNLAALLTYDIPVRQVNSIQDLADLDYTVYAQKEYFVYFNDTVFKGRLIEKLENEGCIPQVILDPSIACLTWGSVSIDVALESNLHVSTDCIITDYSTFRLPWNWPLRDRFNKFLGIMTAAGILGPLDMIVNEIRFLEEESEAIPLKPRIMTLSHLGFAFVILGVGLACAFISFIIEIMIYRYHRRVTTTRIIVLN